jgi:hypothetical protein
MTISLGEDIIKKISDIIPMKWLGEIKDVASARDLLCVEWRGI